MSFSFRPKDSYSEAKFQPYQIVCLEHKETYLYAEVVQTADVKPVCWVRPIALVENSLSSAQQQLVGVSAVYDLRQSSDLLLPTTLFRAAFDVEMLPLFTQLDVSTSEAASLPETQRNQLNQFVKQVCLANPEAFGAPA